MLWLFCLQTTTAAQHSKDCPLSSADYAHAGYKVKEIKVDTPLQVFTQVKSKISEIKTDLAQPGKYSNDEAKAHPLREKEIFNGASWSEGAKIAREKFDGDLATTGRVMVTLVLPHLQACRDKDTSLGNLQGEPTLVVEYKVYTTEYLDYLSSIYENEGQGLSRAILPTRVTKFLSSNSPRPYVGFHRSRAIFGGASLVSNSDNPLFNQFNIDASGSSSSAQTSFRLQGLRELNSKVLSHAEWVGGYKYSNIPSTSMTLKEGRMAGQFVGASQPLGKLKLIVRYGASVEGGNKQSDIAPGSVPQGILTSTGYASLKFFVGGTFRHEGHDFTASYGIELGGTGSDRHVDYIKHILDVGYSVRFLPQLHKPITLDTHLTAGDLDARGPIPLGARFFGGNAEQNFLSSDDWTIHSLPFIRSFAQNQFVPAGQLGPIGGDQFYSFNATFAPTVWGHPLVPKEVINSPDFLPQVNGAFNTVENATFATYLVDYAAVTDFAERLSKLGEASTTQASPLNIIKNKLVQFETQFAGDADALEIISDTRSAVDDLQTQFWELKTEIAKKGQVIAKLQRVSKDFTSCTDFGDATPGVSSSLHVLAAGLKDLMQLLDDKGIPVTDERRQKIAAQKDLVDPLYKTAPCEYALLVSTDVACSCQGNVDERTKQALINAQSSAQRRAKETIAPARELFDRLTKELNLIAISPLLIFDAAKIRSRIPSSTASTTRYGVGGGVRFSIVSLDVDLGYAFNARRQVPERRGAFIFSLRINDLLR